VTLAASKISDHTATLNGSVNPNGCTGGSGGGTWSFALGKTTTYGLKGGSGVFNPTSKVNLPVSFTMYDLEASSVYHFQLTSFGPCGSGLGVDLTFTTTAQVNPALAAVTSPATNVSDTSATVGGTVSPYSCQAPVGGGSWSVVYGLTTSYGQKGPAGVFDPKSSSPLSEMGAISNLSPNTTYHFAVSAADGCGSAQGADLSFTTGSTSAVPMAKLIVGGLLGLGALGFAAFKLGWLKMIKP
jgi:hypothetical protein